MERGEGADGEVAVERAGGGCADRPLDDGEATQPPPDHARAARVRRARMVLGILGLLYLAVALGLDRYGARRPTGRWDAIVVAGCRVMPGGRPSPALARRARLAAELWAEGRAPRIVFTGGVGENPPSEASVAARVAREAGVPEEAILLEERSTSTEENAEYAAALLPEGSRVLVVSDGYHVLRCERVFGRHFGEVSGAGSTSQPWPRVKGALREVLALGAYAVLGRL